MESVVGLGRDFLHALLTPGSLSRLKTLGGVRGTRFAAIRHVPDPREESRQFLEMTPAALVDLRRQLLNGLDEHPAWVPVEAYLARLLRAEFDPATSSSGASICTLLRQSWTA